MIIKLNSRKKYQIVKVQKLFIVFILIGFLSAFISISYKNTTEYYEKIFFHSATINRLFFIAFPLFGLSAIYFLRHYLFNKKENKGIKEVFENTNSASKDLPRYKIPSHFINGLLTLVSRGSTGIEISTVAATATIGSVTQRKERVFRKYKKELICAGIAVGITVLFSSTIVGNSFFSLEIISRKLTKVFLFTNIISVAIATGLSYILNEKHLFEIDINTWHYKALPFFILLGIIAAIHSVNLTRCVLFFKAQFLKIKRDKLKIFSGSYIISLSLYMFPELFSDGYHAIKTIFISQYEIGLSVGLTFAGFLLLKPIFTSATLASRGDGSAFAPSLFSGVFLGLFLALNLNTYFNVGVIPINFIILGMAAVLSSSIYALFTAFFLVCGLTNDYTLIFPVLMVSLVANYIAKFIFPFTVYTYYPHLVKPSYVVNP
jgi:CIC family chloride channel protein